MDQYNDLEKILNNNVGGINTPDDDEHVALSSMQQQMNSVGLNAEHNEVVKETANIKTRPNFFKNICSVALLGLVCGAVMACSFNMINWIFDQTKTTEMPTVQEIQIELGAAELIDSPEGDLVTTSVSTVAKNTMPACVSITNLSVQQVQSMFFGVQEYEYESSGSGVIVGKNDQELLLITNYHVIEGNKSLTVTFIDNESVSAIVKGQDANIDIAVLAVKLDDLSTETLKAIKVATLGDSDALMVGEPTIAIGNALGYGQSVTSGIVSALSRKVDDFDTTLIQTDAAINPGNSGGALLNIRGEVIGINTAKVNADAVEGMGYAIPISEVKEVIEEMMNRETKEKVPEEKRGKLGITCVTVDETGMTYYNMPKGAYINEVVADGAMDRAGVSRGSIITKFDGITITGSTELVDLLTYYEAYEQVKVEIAIPNASGEYEVSEITVTLLPSE